MGTGGQSDLELGYVEVRLPSGEHRTLFHGDIIGRLWSAALRLDDPRISEAHAMISNRHREMKLLALRGRFMAGGKSATDVALEAGMQLTLAPGLDLEVVEVGTPRAVLLVGADGLAPRGVPGVLSLYGGAEPRIRNGWRPDAHATLWPTGEGWMRSGDPPVAITGATEWNVGGTTFRAWIEATDTGVAPTQRDASLAVPLTLVARYDTFHLLRSGRPVCVLTGRSARLLSELVVLAQPCSWESLAIELWGPMDRADLRRRWDMQLQRLRQKLRAGSVRTDLVQATGNGLIELVLGPEDTVVDET
ncbi:MAG: hypothetical protein H6737_21460 [Alphaproteobacteria bacterium]|nr:hypothetical protein [Alphaproteobacteria bacterium]